MGLRKDDPVYYKLKMNKLIQDALNNGLKVGAKHLENGVSVYFEATNGDICGINLLEVR
ncbi:hypothetical protein [Clostridium weizhouense]|uniref:Uncharacterized protein n=1 Tax=Clostridium weizhouense TaxID=2859781 RepID=A0ABS7AK12_9CLOT|nr:hypothetical protein [Clostridium weizhouense]MBW6408999.1 hypothetical protein [Clostridium weizhouense]